MSNIYVEMGGMMEIIIWIFIFFFVIGFFSSGKMKNGNDKAKSFKLNRDTQQKTDNNVSQFFSVDSILGTTVDGVKPFNSAIGELNDYVRFESEVQKAVSVIKGECSFERCVITDSLDSAERKLSIEKYLGDDEERRRQHYKFVEEIISSMPERSERFDMTSVPGFETRLCIDMVYTNSPHPEQKIELAIKNRHENIVEEHNVFLTIITNKIKKDHQLRLLFEEELQKKSPDVLKRIHCFEAGGEWRYVRSFREAKRTETPRFNFNVADVIAGVNSSVSKKIEVRDKYTTSDSPTFLSPENMDESQLLWRKTVDALAPTIKKNKVKHSKTTQDIESIVTTLEIPFLLHFTQATNLPSILNHGLYSIEKAKEAGIVTNINDNLRLDNRLNGTSVSIAYPNAKMLYKYRIEKPKADWVIIAIDPSVLWEKDCAFCKKNAATKFIRDLPVNQLKTAQAFQSMFDEVNDINGSLRKKLSLYSCDPTDVQAEVLVLDIIEPQYINAILFEKGDVYDEYAIDILISGVHKAFVSGDGIVDFFAPRTAVRKN